MAEGRGGLGLFLCGRCFVEESFFWLQPDYFRLSSFYSQSFQPRFVSHSGSSVVRLVCSDLFVSRSIW